MINAVPGEMVNRVICDHIVLAVRSDLIASNLDSVENVLNLVVVQGDAIVLGGADAIAGRNRRVEDRPH